MKLCRFLDLHQHPRVGLVRDDLTVLDLGPGAPPDFTALLESRNLPDTLRRLRDSATAQCPVHALESIRLLPPVGHQEVWAAGVTYLRSKKARMDESEFSASAYDRVYEAERPELFFKSMPGKVVGPGEPVGIRRDARWSVPEPELVLVLNSRSEMVGCSIGNDMSSRDIEGENLLYLPQAKIYERSCAIGPWIVIDTGEAEMRTWTIQLEIRRDTSVVFAGNTSADQIRRQFAELAEFLFRCQAFPHGALLLTGTGVVPPDHFTLQPDDLVTIRISGIGSLENRVVRV